MKRFVPAIHISSILLMLGMLLVLPAAAQQVDLPSELFVLTNEGVVERYGVNAVGTTPVTPEDVYVLDFGLDALGERLAYRTESGITLLGLSGGSGVSLEGAAAGLPPYRGLGDTIAWSPGGDALAYTTLDGLRIYMETGAGPVFQDLTQGIFLSVSWSPGGTFVAAEAEDNIWWIYRRNGNTMELASAIPSSIGTAWVSNAEIVFAPASGGLNLMNLEAANAQTTLLGENIEYRLPFLTADDQLVFFARPKDSATIPEGGGILMRLARGASQVETLGQRAVPLSGLQWAPGGTMMTAFQGGVLALFNPITGEGIPLPINNAVAFDWAPLLIPAIPVTAAPPTPTTSVLGAPLLPTAEAENTAEATPEVVPISTTTGLVLSADSYFIAHDPNSIAQVWRMPADGNTPFRFTGAQVDVGEFTIAPDGRNVAYVSDGDLWLQRFEVPQPILLATLNTFAPITPAFSPDGTRLVYAEERVNAISGGIWSVALDGTEPTLVLPNDERSFRRPQWSPDGTRLLLDVYTADGGIVSGIFTLETGDLEETEPSAPDDVRPLTARWLRDGDILAYTDAGFNSSVDPGLYIFDSIAPNTSPVQWLPLPENILVRDVVDTANDQYRALLTTGGDAPIRVVDISGVQQQELTTVRSLVAPHLSPDGRFIAGYDSMAVIDGVSQGSLVVVDLQRGGQFLLSEPPTLWGFQWTG